MTHINRRFPHAVSIRGFAALLLLASCQFAALAQSAYPAKPIHLVVPYPPGGATDILARAVGEKLSKSLAQPVVVENKPGAASSIGAAAVAKAAPDGYTLLLGTNVTFAVNQFVYTNLPYDPAKDFTPVAPLALAQAVLLVSPRVKASNVPELIAEAKAAGDKFSYASYGIGSSAHLSGAQFAGKAGLGMTHVPYKGSAPALADLLGGHVSILFDSIVTAAPMVKSGKARGFAVTGKTRSATLPDLPTVAEQGLPGYESTAWYAIAVPSGTPASIVQRLNEEINKALSSKDVMDLIAGAGAESMTMSQAEFARFVLDERSKYASMLKSPALKLD